MFKIITLVWPPPIKAIVILKSQSLFLQDPVIKNLLLFNIDRYYFYMSW